MKEKEILENNRLIAKFIGDQLQFPTTFNDTRCISEFDPEMMCFHLSWDWLMPVVKKMEELFDNGHTYFEEALAGHYTDIDYVYNECVKYIKIFKPIWIKDENKD